MVAGEAAPTEVRPYTAESLMSMTLTEIMPNVPDWILKPKDDDTPGRYHRLAYMDIVSDGTGKPRPPRQHISVRLFSTGELRVDYYWSRFDIESGIMSVHYDPEAVDPSADNFKSGLFYGGDASSVLMRNRRPADACAPLPWQELIIKAKLIELMTGEDVVEDLGALEHFQRLTRSEFEHAY